MSGVSDRITRASPAMDAVLPREALRGRTVVVALDQGPAAGSVARVAHDLARTYGSVPCVIRAFDVSGVPHSARLASMLAAADALLGDGPHEAQRRAVRNELWKLLGEPVGWPVHVHPGSPADVIVHEAAEREAVLIVLGIRRHGMFDRMVRDETTLNVVRRADCTVLGVAPSLWGRPGCVLVGMDFSPASVAAAQMAVMLLAGTGTLVLANVRTDAGAGAGGTGASEGGTDQALEALVAALAVPTGTTVLRVGQEVAPTAGVAAALLAIAGEHQAELIAVGSRRHSWLDRALEESVSTDLVRDGRRSVLVVPPPPHRFAHEISTRTQEARHVDDHQ